MDRATALRSQLQSAWLDAAEPSVDFAWGTRSSQRRCNGSPACTGRTSCKNEEADKALRVPKTFCSSAELLLAWLAATVPR